MKRLIRAATVTSGTDTLMFSPTDIVDLLSKITELQGSNISLCDNVDDAVKIIINDTVYEFSDSK